MPLGVDPEEWGLDSEYPPPPGVHTCLGGGGLALQQASVRVSPHVSCRRCSCWDAGALVTGDTDSCVRTRCRCSSALVL